MMSFGYAIQYFGGLQECRLMEGGKKHFCSLCFALLSVKSCSGARPNDFATLQCAPVFGFMP
jgi:hypothetical protein